MFYKKIYHYIISYLTFIGLSLLILYFLIYPIFIGFDYNFWSEKISNDIILKKVLNLAFYWITAIPFLISLVFSFNVAFEIKKENLYSENVIKFTRISMFFIIVNLLLLFAKNIILLIIKKDVFSSLDLLILIIGMVCVFFKIFFICVIQYGIFNERKGLLNE